MTKDLHLLAAGSGWGASNMGTGDGPLTLAQSQNPLTSSGKTFAETFFTACDSIHAHPDPIEPLYPLSGDALQTRLKYLTSAIHQVYTRTLNILRANQRPFVLGGDHSIAIGTWSAVKDYLQQPFGLIWIDAHLDAHSPATSPSQARHGMPTATLMGHGDTTLARICRHAPALQPNKLAFIGSRDFEIEEYDLAKKLGICIFDMDDIKSRGFDAVFKDAKSRVTLGNTPYGVSLDIDAFDPVEAPGTGAPASNGLMQADVLPTLNRLFEDPNLLAFELAEFDPHRDQDGRTLKLAWNLLHSLRGDK